MNASLMLFSGPPGTGKTMAAQSIAESLGAPLFKIDLSSVVSKYIGETEKNLNKLFREAEESAAILFFDEADALFGKRSEIRDSHDRYANVEVNYFQKKIEEYSGCVIIAAHSVKNIDDTFLGKAQSVVEFSATDGVLRDKQKRQIRDLQELISRKRR